MLLQPGLAGQSLPAHRSRCRCRCRLTSNARLRPAVLAGAAGAAIGSAALFTWKEAEDLAPAARALGKASSGLQLHHLMPQALSHKPLPLRTQILWSLLLPTWMLASSSKLPALPGGVGAVSCQAILIFLQTHAFLMVPRRWTGAPVAGSLCCSLGCRTLAAWRLGRCSCRACNLEEL
jgi:hypothetical protein